RTARTEYLKVEAVIRRTALAHPEVDLSLTRDGRPHLRARPATDAATERSRIRDLCGAAFADQAVSFERSSEAMRCYGWIAPPLQARASADVQHICVNGRVVRDPLLRHALRSAFDDAVAPGRHPAYVIYLDLPVADVDVNVHPTKHELRFHDARTVHDFVWSVVRDVAGINAQTNEDALTTAVRPSFDADDGAPPVSSETAPPHPMAFAAHPRQGSHRGQMQAYVKLTAQPPGRVGEEPADSEKVTLPLTPTIALRLTTRFALCRLPGGGHGFLDVAALASEATLATMTRPPVIAAPLLLPASKIVASAIMDALDEHATALGELGFGLRRLGPETMAIVEVPAILTHLPASELWLALEACAHPSVDVKVLIDLLRTAAAEVAPDLANADIQALFTIKSACDVALKPLTEATLLAFFQTSPR
ncbi:MAG: hypothetical protein HOI95_26785, partial [Chromatiales bacterium]|nr:hypothetical protein [Chromatiales bacterium]